MVMSLHFDPILAHVSPAFLNRHLVGSYRAIFGYVSHEESSKLE
jgi:hypothetical protein